jgi:hypothetical protein
MSAIGQADIPKNAFGSKADMGWCTALSAFDPKRTLLGASRECLALNPTQGGGSGGPMFAVSC